MAESDFLVAWLKDAHAMEVALIPVLENHARDAKAYPNVHARLMQHAQETRRHAEMIQDALARWDEKPSAVKEAVGNVTGMMQSIMTGAFQDEMLKNALSDFAAENFEIACYNALIIAAETLGDDDTAELAQEILEDEEDMAAWLDENLALTVQEALALKAREEA